MTQIVTYIVASLSVIVQIALVVLLAAYFSKASWAKELKNLVAEKYLWLGLLISVGAVAGSLFYSEIAGFDPCKLCWLQRIFIYPQAVLFAVALVKNKKDVADYAVPLSAIGGLIAAYHYYIQLGGLPLITCSATDAGACAQRFVMMFGYITIPMMALSAFALLFVAGLISQKYKK
jgi:disulfide bond formation protein DsbB